MRKVEWLVVGQKSRMSLWVEVLSLAGLVSHALPSTSASASTSTPVHFSIFKTEICDNDGPGYPALQRSAISLHVLQNYLDSIFHQAF